MSYKVNQIKILCAQLNGTEKKELSKTIFNGEESSLHQRVKHIITIWLQLNELEKKELRVYLYKDGNKPLKDDKDGNKYSGNGFDSTGFFDSFDSFDSFDFLNFFD